MPEGVVTFHRQVLATPPQWEKSTLPLSRLHVDSRGTIEDQGHGMLQARNNVNHNCALACLVLRQHFNQIHVRIAGKFGESVFRTYWRVLNLATTDTDRIRIPQYCNVWRF